jgi:hypothetical protein
MDREDIVTLFTRIESMKETDPRYRGSVEEQLSFYKEVDNTIREAGWRDWWEYQTTLFNAMGGRNG